MTTRNGKSIAIPAAVLVLAVLGVVAWRWPNLRFYWLFEPLGTSAYGLKEFRHRRTGIVFVRVPGGLFSMGSPEGEPMHQADEGPVHEVELSPFLIAKYETSQAEWERVTGSNPSLFRGPDLPVDSVSWDDCQEFCRKAGLRLPTEAQWEYACRAGTTTPFAFGNTITLEQANYRGDYPYGSTPKATARMQTVPVGSFRPNGFGLYQTHGNVSEWCQDVLGIYTSSDAPPQDYPLRVSEGLNRVHRGGGWWDPAWRCRSAYRGYDDLPVTNMGVRAVYHPLP